MASQIYSLFGLRIASEVPIPELPAQPGGATDDVEVRVGQIPVAASFGSGVHAVDGGALLVVDDVGRFLVSAGSRILVEPAAAVPEQNIRLYLLGSAFGLLLHQRGVLPLHANAVEIDCKAVAFMGESGAGKSTLAAWFHDRGHRIVADDVCAIRFDGTGQALAIPGLPRLRLWREAIEATGRDVAAYPRSFIDEDGPDECDVPVASGAAAAAAIPLVAVYLLGRADQPRIERLDGLAAAEAVFANTYRGGYMELTGGQVPHWHACVRLVRCTSVFSAGRRWGLGELDQQGSFLLDHAERQVAAVG